MSKEAIKRLDALEAEAKEIRKLLTVKAGKITDRIKTFEDALNEIGGVSDNAQILLKYNGTDNDMIAAQAQMKLSIIARALNEGWKADWTDHSQYKYYPWFEYKSGFGFSSANYGNWYADASVGSRLCFKNRELAEYAGKQFQSLYNDLFNY